MIEIVVSNNRVLLVENGIALLVVNKDNVVQFDDSIKSIGESCM